MNILQVYSAYLNTLVDTAKRTVMLEPVDSLEPVKEYYHLKSSPFILTEEIEYGTKVVTAHKLSQYQNTIHNVRLKDDVSTWLDILLEQTIKEYERINE